MTTTTMSNALVGRTVLVTGAAGGIGQSLIEALVERRAAPWLHYRSSEAAARSLATELGLEIDRLVQADLRDEGEVAAMFDQCEAGTPAGVRSMVVNAGIWPTEDVAIRDMEFAQWKNTLASNLDSAFLCCREFLRRLPAGADDPAIVLIGSTSGRFGEEGHGDYSSSKAAMRGLMLTLKNEIVRRHPRGRINMVSPGWVATPMAEPALADTAVVDRVTSTMAMRKVASPEDVARAVLFFLCSRDSGHVSGQELVVAGGMEGRLLHPGAGQ